MIATASLLVIAAVSAIGSSAVSASEKAAIMPYGATVRLAEGDVNVVRTGGAGPTMVLLSGYGTAAPAIDFAPLIRELDEYDVIVIEGFGYGYSDLDVADRSIENITSEIHQVLDKLNVQHSSDSGGPFRRRTLRALLRQPVPR